jgi:sodium transport system permease protein
VTAPWWIVFRKEVRETVRDRRTMLVMLAVPILLYPTVLIGTEQLFLLGARNLEAESSPVAVVGDAPRALLDLIAGSDALRLEAMATGDAEAELRSGAVAAVAVMGGDVGPEATRRSRCRPPSWLA